MKSRTAELASLQAQLSSQKETNSLLEHQIKTLQRELANITQEKDEHIKALNHELEEKTTSIAYLVTQLHRTKRLLQKSQEDERSLACSRASDGDQVIKPSPPKKSPPEAAYKTGLITKRLRRTCSTPPIEAHSYVPRLHRNRQDSPDAAIYPHSQPFSGANTASLSSIETKRAPEKISSFYHPLNSPVTPSHWIKQHPAVPSTTEFDEHFSGRTKQQPKQTQTCKLPLRQQAKVVLPPIRPDTPPHFTKKTALLSSSGTASSLDHPNSALARKQRLQRRRVLANSQTRASSSMSYQQAVTDDADGEEEELAERDEDEGAVEGTLMVRQEGLGSQSSWRQLHQSHAK